MNLCVESRDREFETKDDGILGGMPIDQMVRGVLEDYNLMRGGEDDTIGKPHPYQDNLGQPDGQPNILFLAVGSVVLG